MDIRSYVRRSVSTAEIAASIAVYAGSEAFTVAGATLKRAAATFGALVEKASVRGETAVRDRRRARG